MTQEPSATDRLLSQIRNTEDELRRHLDHIHSVLDHIDQIRSEDVARYHGLLLTLRHSLDGVRSLGRTESGRLLGIA